MSETHEQLIENTIPVLAVRDVQVSLRFYCDLLEFQRDWGGDGEMSDIASVSRDDQPIMLQRRNPAGSGCVWIGVSSLVSLWNLVRSNEAIRVVQPPTNHRWALEMRIHDPDGNVLRLGSENKPGEPFGDWLDMLGIHWRPKPEGGWARVD